jgi:signal transduction histidine kinase
MYTLSVEPTVPNPIGPSISEHQQVMTDVLARMLRYEHAVARCSQELLVAADLTDPYNATVLTQALEHLRIGAEVDRAYFFRCFFDPELGDCIEMMAEASGPGVPRQILNPVNHCWPWSKLSPALHDALQAGQPFGGPLEQLFAATPDLPALLKRTSDKSTQCVPVHTCERWWGFIGFDDVQTVRDWDDQEVLLLSTAADMIGNTLQRWHSEVELHEARQDLEERVQARTQQLSERLQIEQTLAAISARLLGVTDFEREINATLGDVGLITRANRVMLIRLDNEREDPVMQTYAWHISDQAPLTSDDIEAFVRSGTSTWLRRKLTALETVLVSDVAQLPIEARQEQLVLQQRHIRSFAALPLGAERKLIGVLVCTNTTTTDWSAAPQWQILDVIKGLLSSLFAREHLLETLEQRVTDRTRELAAFSDLTMLTMTDDDLNDVLQPALHGILEAGKCEALSLHLLNPNVPTLELGAYLYLPEAAHNQQQMIEVTDTFAARLQQADTPLIFTQPVLPADVPAAFSIPEFQSYLGCPLTAGEQVLGWLSCYRVADTGFGMSEASFLVALARQVGVIIENHRLRARSSQIAVVEERQRLARELHDAVTQALYSQLLFARAGRDALEEDDWAKLRDSLQQVESNATLALKEMRLLLYQLRPAALQHGHLIEVIDERFDLVERRLGLQATCSMDDDIALSPDLEDMLYRVTLEALNNVVKHANASTVQVYLCRHQTHLYLSIHDDGRSFEVERAQGGMGLSNMQARVTAFDGQLEFVTQPERGTEVRIAIPLPENDPEGLTHE